MHDGRESQAIVLKLIFSLILFFFSSFHSFFSRMIGLLKLMRWASMSGPRKILDMQPGIIPLVTEVETKTNFVIDIEANTVPGNSGAEKLTVNVPLISNPLEVGTKYKGQ